MRRYPSVALGLRIQQVTDAVSSDLTEQSLWARVPVLTLKSHLPLSHSQSRDAEVFLTHALLDFAQADGKRTYLDAKPLMRKLARAGMGGSRHRRWHRRAAPYSEEAQEDNRSVWM